MTVLTSAKIRGSTLAQPTSTLSFDLGGAGQDVHFLHANGYPPACYAPLLDRLQQKYHVFGMLLRPLWPGRDPQEIKDWKPLSEDLRTYLHQVGARGGVGLGHSIGAVVTLRAAVLEPGLFRALVLIDPVLLPPTRIFQLRLMHLLGIRRSGTALVQGALRRRRRFDDLEQLFAGYRRRDIFRYFSDENLHSLIAGLTIPAPNGGYELAYSPEWEARIYETGIWNDADLWNGLPKLALPTLFLRGDRTDTFFASTAEMARRRNPAVRVITIPDATHLVPLERPAEVFRALSEFLDSTLKA